MTRQRGLKITLMVLVGVAVGWWVWHPRPTDRELIEELIARAEHGVETKSVDEIMSCLSRDYERQGDLSREDIWRMAMQWARSSAQADVLIEDYRLTLEGPEATGYFRVKVELTEDGFRRPALALSLTVDFVRRRSGLRTVWLVHSIGGFDPDLLVEELL